VKADTMPSPTATMTTYQNRLKVYTIHTVNLDVAKRPTYLQINITWLSVFELRMETFLFRRL